MVNKTKFFLLINDSFSVDDLGRVIIDDTRLLEKINGAVLTISDHAASSTSPILAKWHDISCNGTCDCVLMCDECNTHCPPDTACHLDKSCNPICSHNERCG